MQVVCRTIAYILEFLSKNYMAYIQKRMEYFNGAIINP
jgi:hypothetical protein